MLFRGFALLAMTMILMRMPDDALTVEKGVAL